MVHLSSFVKEMSTSPHTTTTMVGGGKKHDSVDSATTTTTTTMGNKKKVKLIVKRQESTRKKRSPRHYSPQSSPVSGTRGTTSSLPRSSLSRKSLLSIELPPQASSLPLCSPTRFGLASPCTTPVSTPVLQGDTDGFEVAQKARYDPTAWQGVQCIDVPQCRRHSLYSDESAFKNLVQQEVSQKEYVTDQSDEAFYLRHYHSFLSHTKREEEVLARASGSQTNTRRQQRSRDASSSSTADHDNNSKTKDKKRRVSLSDKSLLRTDSAGKPIVPRGLSCSLRFNYQNNKRRVKSTQKWTQPKSLIIRHEDEARFRAIAMERDAAAKAASAVAASERSRSVNVSAARKRKKRSRASPSNRVVKKPARQQQQHQQPPNSSFIPTALNGASNLLLKRQQELMERLQHLQQANATASSSSSSKVECDDVHMSSSS